MKTRQPAKAIGRPRSFCKEGALDAAMKVFWRAGYEGASLAELTGAMGINRPSLYATFGNKESLFRQAVDHYEAGPAAYVREALEEATARAVVTRLMEGAADLTTDPRYPRGCLSVQGALACSAGAQSVQKEMKWRHGAGERALRLRLQRAKAEGDLPRDAKPAELARYVVTVIRGIAVQAASGTTRKELRGVVQTALLAWPH